MKDILTRIDEIWTKFSDRTAIAEESLDMTYHELKEVTKRIASALYSYHLRNKPIAIYMDKSAKCICTMLGVLFSGNFYTVIDTQMPEERINSILETLQPAMIITDKQHLTKCNPLTHQKTVLLYEYLSRASLNRNALISIQNNRVDTDPAYVIFTSGSTGRPKGTIISHKALYSYIQWFTNEFCIDETSIFGSQTPLFFSMSVSDLYGSLFTGAAYHIIPKKYFSFPLHLVEYLNSHEINTIYWVPSALCIVANWDTFCYAKPCYLTKVLFAGESMPNRQLNYWRKYFPNILYANLFGPTETTDICCFYVVDRLFDDDEPLPIGKPCDNCGILIIGENGEESDEGELMVRGSFLANGYYNEPQKTSEVFIQNPAISEYPDIVYRTGDIVRRELNGELSYLGRKDFQIKHKGYRIELGEIETVAGALSEIQVCACVYDKMRECITLYYQGNMTKNELAEYIVHRLPSYMCPNEYISLKQMPYNANGKINRNVLGKYYIV